MAASEECRKNAEECLGRARTAKSENDRKSFLDMARTWTQAAALSDGASANANHAEFYGEQGRRRLIHSARWV